MTWLTLDFRHGGIVPTEKIAASRRKLAIIDPALAGYNPKKLRYETA
jgi:hypothetical protein